MGRGRYHARPAGGKPVLGAGVGSGSRWRLDRTHAGTTRSVVRRRRAKSLLPAPVGWSHILTAPDRVAHSLRPNRGRPMPTQPSRRLETFPNPARDRDYVIRHECPEYT